MEFDPKNLSINRSLGIEIKYAADQIENWHILAPVIGGVEIRKTKNGNEYGSISISRLQMRKFIAWLGAALDQLEEEEKRAEEYRRGG